MLPIDKQIKETKSVLEDSFTLLSLADLGLEDDIPEDENTLRGKPTQSPGQYSATGKNVFADDTGLEIEALDGQPGVHSARFAVMTKIQQPISKRSLPFWANPITARPD